MSGNDDQHFELKHVIGASTSSSARLCLLNESTIVYPAANQIILHNTLENSQQFINTGGSVTAISVSHSTNLLAVSEKGSGDVKLFDTSTLRCKRTLATDATNDIISLSLSRDAKKCLTLGGSPDHVLTMWDVDRSTVFVSLKLSKITKKDLSSVSMSPDCSQICVIGEKVIRLFHLSTTTKRFQAIKKATYLSISPNYTAQLFLGNGDLVIGSDSGSLLVLGNDMQTKQLLKVEYPVTSLAPCPRGFAIGCSEGTLVIFQQINKDSSFAVTRTIYTQQNSPIRSMVVTRMQQGSQSVIYLTDNRSIVQVPLIDNGNITETEVVPSLNISTRPDIDNLIPDAGSLFVDSCVWKPLIVIGGNDGVIRIFNYQTRQITLTQKFDEKICSLSFHSTGQYLLVSSPSTVSLNVVLMDKLSTLWQVDSSSKQSPALTCFSKGSLFAISLGGTTTIQVHDIQSSFEIVSTLRGGHTKAIIEMSFCGHKDELVSVGADGVVCLWDTNRCMTKTRTVDFTSPAFLSAVVTRDCSHVFAISADGQLKKIDVVKGELVAQAKLDASAKLMTSLEDGKVVISTTDGCVECISLSESSIIIRQSCFDSSQSRVSSIHQCTSGLLISASRDGFVSIYNRRGTEEQSSNYRPLDGISVISSVEHVKQVDIENELQSNINTIESNHKAAIESAQADHEARKATLKDELEMKRDRLKYEINELRDGNDAQEKHHKDQVDLIMTEHQKNTTSVRQDYEKKIEIEKNNTVKLSKSIKERKVEHTSQLTELEKRHSELINKETIALSEILVAANEKNEQLLSDIKRLKQQAKEQQKETELDAEKEISDLAAKHSSALQLLKEKNSLLNTDKSILKQRTHTQLEDLKELNFQVSFQEDKVQASEETVSTLIAQSRPMVLPLVS